MRKNNTKTNKQMLHTQNTLTQKVMQKRERKKKHNYILID